MNSAILLLLFAVPGAGADDAADSRQVLDDHGVKVLSSTLVMDEESELRSRLAKSSRVRRTMQAAAKKLAIGERQLGQIERTIGGLTQANVQINARLTNANSVAVHNRLVAANNANIGRINLLQKQYQSGRKEVAGLRATAIQAQEDFVEYLMTMRELADSINAERESAAAEDDVQAAIAALNQADDKEYTLEEPSRAFTVALKKLEELEALVLSEEIAIRRSAGGTSRVSVVVNGEKAVDMVVDSGASIITLPASAAAGLNVTLKRSDPPITLILADGRQITGTLVKLKSVRVGQFEVEDVECAVLGPEAINAEPLLGMSFLGKFEFQINAADETLTLTRVGEAQDSKRNR